MINKMYVVYFNMFNIFNYILRTFVGHFFKSIYVYIFVHIVSDILLYNRLLRTCKCDMDYSSSLIIFIYDRNVVEFIS